MKYLEELKRKYEELGKEIQRLEKRETTRWRADEDDVYYYVAQNGVVTYLTDADKLADRFRYKIRNYFKSDKEAKNYLENINTYYDLMDLADKLNGSEEIDWKNHKQRKYYIYYHVLDDMLYSTYTIHVKNINQIYCLDPDFQVKALEIIGKDKLKNLFIGWSSYAK